MDTQKLPFEITPEVKRYLEDILYLHDEWRVHSSNVFYLIKEEIKGEHSTPRRWDNNEKFWEYLRQQKIVIAYPNLSVDMIKDVIGDKPMYNLFAIARPYEEKGPQVYRFLAAPDHRQENFEKVEQLASEYSRDGEIDRLYVATRIFNFEFIRELFHKITAKEDMKIDQKFVKSYFQDSKVRFDPLNGVIRYGDEMLRFQRGSRGDRPRLALFKELWELKKHIQNGKIKAEGRAFPPETLAVRLNIINEPSVFKRNHQAQDKFFGFVKGINRECPICGEEKQAKHLVCNGCYQIYTGEAGRSLARDGKIPAFTVWAYEKIEKRLGELKNQLAHKRKEYIALQDQVCADAYTVITNLLKGRKISPEIFKNALAEKKKEVWKMRKGDRLHYELKSTESKIVFLQGLKDELQTKIQSFESHPASDVFLLPQTV